MVYQLPSVSQTLRPQRRKEKEQAYEAVFPVRHISYNSVMDDSFLTTQPPALSKFLSLPESLSPTVK